MKIALAGNPNSGKTTLFNALTGSNQYVGNWPGVTVEKKEGRYRKDKDVIITDLPGIYSLSPYTLEEVVARNYLLDEDPDGIINIVDGTNLERNLYLTTQLTELNIPMVIAINMADVIEKNGDTVNTAELEKAFGAKVVLMSAVNKTNTDDAVTAVKELIAKKSTPKSEHPFSAEVEHCLAHIEESALANVPESKKRFYSIKLFERDEKAIEKLGVAKDVLDHIEKEIKAVESKYDDDAESIITGNRYEYIEKVTAASYKKKNRGHLTTSDKIDRIVTNRFAALPIFAVVMFLVYYLSIQTVGTMGTDWVNDVLLGDIIPPAVESFLASINCADWLSSLIVNGIIAGVGSVLGFLPQMIVLFICLALLEECGYMARIAFIMDRIFRRFGLSGKSFIPMMIGTGCGVPGVMASRTIESERDRRMTVMTTTFIPCSAKLPVIAMIAGAVFGESGLVGVSAYFLGVFAIITSGIILKKTRMFEGDPAPFVMELPAYHMPRLGNVFHSVWERTAAFVKKAGTIILLSTIFVHFITHFGWDNGVFGYLDIEAEEAIETGLVDSSIAAKLGSIFGLIFAPLGFGDWRSTVATLTGLVAKENVVGTFGILFRTVVESEEGVEFWAQFASSYTKTAAYSLLAFNLLCAPCFAAIGAIKREMNDRKWTWFAIAWDCGYAYVIAFILYHLGNLLVYKIFNFWTILAVAVLAVFVWALVRKPKHNLEAVNA